jgi:cytochrome P450
MFNLTKEIRKNFSDISEIRIGQTLNSCKLLTACVDESLRLSPIVGGCLMREVGPGGITVNGRVIPRGVDVGVPHHVIMRNPKYYDDPLEYNPQRWLPTETSNENLKVARAAFCPFGIGPTGCVGKAWALVEMKITLAQLLFQYDLQRAVVDNARDSSITQYLDHRERHSIDRFIITNSGPDIRFRLARRT